MDNYNDIKYSMVLIFYFDDIFIEEMKKNLFIAIFFDTKELLVIFTFIAQFIQFVIVNQRSKKTKAV